ncbi:MAG: cell division protein SepF [Hadesarchaea archaeon]|nr:cell division protein SepF [Hadesarchaea archaeon]
MEKLKGIFTKKKKKSSKQGGSEVDFGVPVMEVSETTETGEVGEIEPIYVKSMDLNSVVDVQRATNELQNGNVAIINISPLLDEDPEELKRAIDQLRGTTESMGGDVGRLSESKVIATPKFVRIQFKESPTP